MDDFKYFKSKNKIEINLFEKNLLGLDDYEIEFLSKTNKVIDKIEKITSLKKLEILKPEVKNFNINKKKHSILQNQTFNINSNFDLYKLV